MLEYREPSTATLETETYPQVIPFFSQAPGLNPAGATL